MLRSDEDLRQLQRNFVEALRGAEMHWYFVQGAEAVFRRLYLPGVLSLLTGIEATLRITVHQLHGFTRGEELSDYHLLSNLLIEQACAEGLPTDELAFPGEGDFVSKLSTRKPNRIDVRLVALRNDLAHGNVFDFINRELGEDNHFFVPELIEPIAWDVLDIAERWATHLGGFRSSRLPV